eukprot:CAMPEP_0182895216 /NCGR_PEP_ID=MMETSP0034_2-20130328/25548_1 /TAXON_ID=156128 /ORGANISM="Nephroselmis pyriformis, Strain CCMP717" /LENGTH=332 /DNA_ID=CAMNT_0025029039 /DNA_START=36 /DNA_END=1031 /DNA_ORIENTATION=+
MAPAYAAVARVPCPRPLALAGSSRQGAPRWGTGRAAAAARSSAFPRVALRRWGISRPALASPTSVRVVASDSERKNQMKMKEARDAAVEQLRKPRTWIFLGIGGAITVATVGTVALALIGPGIMVATSFAASGMAVAALSLIVALSLLPVVSSLMFGAMGMSALVVGSIGAVIFQAAVVLAGLAFGAWAVGRVLGGEGGGEELPVETEEEAQARKLREELDAEQRRVRDERAEQSKELKEFDRRLLEAGDQGPAPRSAALASRGRSAVEAWGVREVGEWLGELNLSHYRGTFAANDIDGRVLLALEDRELASELGVASFGERKRILDALRGA